MFRTGEPRPPCSHESLKTPRGYPGRGRLDTLHCHAKPPRRIWIYPLMRDFERQLCNR